MKRIEKEFLLLDFEFSKIEISIKRKKMKTLFRYYTESNKENINENVDVPPTTNPTSIDTPTIKEEIDNTTTVDDIKTETSYDKHKEDLLPQEIKDIYRKIVIKTHPDKTKGETYTTEYKDYYKLATEAKENNNKSELIYIAYKLGIKEVFDIPDNHFGNIRYNIKKIELEDTQINNSPLWVWYHTDNIALKNMMMKRMSNVKK